MGEVEQLVRRSKKPIAAKVCLDALFPRFETVEEGHVRRQVY